MADTRIVVVQVGNDGKPVAIPDTVEVLNPDTLLVFYVDTRGYAFPTTGAIVMKNPPPAGAGGQALTVQDVEANFPYAAWSTSASSVALFDAFESSGLFHYSITLINLQTGETVSSDPSVRNGHIVDPEGQPTPR
jgi:hypothetical protein